MWFLVKQHLQHLWRTRLVHFTLLFSVFVQWAILAAARNVHLEFMGQTYYKATFGPRELLFLSLFLQLFTGSFLAMSFGLWTAPYLHVGDRASLTHVLPIPRWKYPLSYSTVMLFLLLLMSALILFVHWTLLGTAPFKIEGFWGLFARGIFFEAIAFEVLMLGFSVGSLFLGPLSAMFVGISLILGLQVAAFFVRPTMLPFVLGDSLGPVTAKLYALLPPFGETTFDLWLLFKGEAIDPSRVPIWLAWFFVFFGLFVVRLKFPRLSRPGAS